MATTIESVAVVAGSRLHRSARKLADRAIEEALAAASIEAGDLDLLVNAGLFHDRVLGEPAMAALLQEDVGANPEDPHGEGHGTFSFDMANGSAGALSALQVVDGFLRSGTIGQAVVVAGDADPGHRIAVDFPHDPVGAALVCGWGAGDEGLAAFRWVTVADPAARRDAVVQLEHGRNRLLVRQDEAFIAEAAAAAGTAAAGLLDDQGLRPGDVAVVAAAPFEASFIDALAPHLGIAPDRFVRPRSDLRLHTAGLIAALGEVQARPSPPGGEWALLVAAGAGISAGAALLRR